MLIEAERDAIASARLSGHTNAKKIQHLVKLKAIGPEFATVLVGEVLYRPFDNRRQLASYDGECRMPLGLRLGSSLRGVVGQTRSNNFALVLGITAG
jgi:hypothetical protein